MIGIFTPGWGTTYAWNSSAGSVTVTTASTPTATPTTPTATPTLPPVACNPRPPVQLTTSSSGGGLQGMSFTMRRQSPASATVNLAVVDRCGHWMTFVGGGPNAF